MKRLLLVDDDRLFSLLLSDFLSDLGYAILSAPTAEKALTMLGCYRPVLIITDVLLPGMSGYEFISRLRVDPVMIDMPVVVVSAGARNLDRQKALATGASAYLSKPFELNMLVGIVDGLLAAHDQN